MGTDMNDGKWGLQQEKKKKSNKLKMKSPLWLSPNLLYSMCPLLCIAYVADYIFQIPALPEVVCGFSLIPGCAFLTPF